MTLLLLNTSPPWDDYLKTCSSFRMALNLPLIATLCSVRSCASAESGILIQSLKPGKSTSFNLHPFYHQFRDATSELEYYIRDVYHNHLKSVDIELYRHLERHHILPQVYAVRWLRLLFGREFPMQDLLCVWDFLFATNLEMVSSFFVAMLVGQRVLLLNDDAGNILRCVLLTLLHINK